MGTQQKFAFDHARDELMSHIHRCGVLKASQEQQDQWLDETMHFMAERYTDLSEEHLAELRGFGRRFCQPVIPHGKDNTALSASANSEQDSEQGEMAGAA